MTTAGLAAVHAAADDLISRSDHETALAALNTAHAAALTATRAEADAAGRAAGATAERERIAGIRALAMPGHEAVIEAAIADPTCTPDQTAGRILAAERVARAGQLQNIQRVEDVAIAVKPAPSAAGNNGADAPAGTPAAWKAEYQADAALQSEFMTEQDYVAYKAAAVAGKVRIKGHK